MADPFDSIFGRQDDDAFNDVFGPQEEAAPPRDPAISKALGLGTGDSVDPTGAGRRVEELKSAPAPSRLDIRREEKRAADAAKPTIIKPDGELERFGAHFEKGMDVMLQGANRTEAIIAESLGFRDWAQTMREAAEKRGKEANVTVEGQVDSEELWQRISGTAPKDDGTWAKVPEKDQRSTASLIANFMLETGIESTPQMALALASIPAYVASLAGGIAQDRATNDNRTNAELLDLVAAVPPAVLSAYLDRLPLEAILTKKLGTSAAKRVLFGMGYEAGTEAIQSPVEYAGGSVGTEKGFSAQEAIKQSVLGAIAGGGMGAGIAGATEATTAAVDATGKAATGFRQRTQFDEIFGAPAPDAARAATDAFDPTTYSGETNVPLNAGDISSPLPTEDIQAGKNLAAELTKPKAKKGALPSDIVQFFRDKGYSDAHARGIAAGIVAESRGDHTISNPDSGAFGLGQWLGPRKAALIERYGPNPTRAQQLEFLHYELQGGDHGGKAVLSATDERGALDAYIKKFMRPAKGAETTGDISRGLAALGLGEDGIVDVGEGSPLGDVAGVDQTPLHTGPSQSPEELLKSVLGEDVLEPTQGQRVDVTQNESTVPGTVEEIWEQDGRKGVRIALDDGTTFDEALDDAREYGARITQPVEPGKETADLGASPAATTEKPGEKPGTKTDRIAPDGTFARGPKGRAAADFTEADAMNVAAWAVRNNRATAGNYEDVIFSFGQRVSGQDGQMMTPGKVNVEYRGQTFRLDEKEVRRIAAAPAEETEAEQALADTFGPPAEDTSKTAETVLEDTSQPDLVPKLKQLLSDTKISLNDTAKIAGHLGVDEKAARAAMGALAAQPDSGFFMTKGRPAKRNKSGRIIRKAVPPRLQRVAKRTTPLTAMEFVRSQGGVQSGSHDLRNVGAIGRHPGVISKKGRSLDEIGRALHEAGYFTDRDPTDPTRRPTESETIEFLEKASQKKTYTADYVPDAANDDEQETYERRAVLSEEVADAGVAFEDEDFATADRYLDAGLTPAAAVRAAMDDANARAFDLGYDESGDEFYAQVRDAIYEGTEPEQRDGSPEEIEGGPASIEEDARPRGPPDRERESAASAGEAPGETGGIAGSTAPEHQGPGVDDRELAEIVAEFERAKAEEEADDFQMTHLFDAPKKSEIVRLNKRTDAYVKANGGFMTVPEAEKLIEEWEDNAVQQGRDPQARAINGDKVVLSLFDLSGVMARPWEQAGYDVYKFDIQNGSEIEINGEIVNVGDVNNFSVEFFNDLFGSFDGKEVHAILAACPCTDFASSGSKHFAAKDKDGRTVRSIQLVRQTLATIEYFKPAVWMIENPVGRIEKLTGLPPWKLSFDPNDVGDNYEKKTLIWGRFNADLPIAPVPGAIEDGGQGSKIHKKYGGKSLKTKNARSVTPEGFSYAFFQANNAIDHPVEAVHGQFDRLDKALIAKAIEAGITPDEITEAVEDFYYQELDDEAANEAIQELIDDAGGTPTPTKVDEGTTAADLDMSGFGNEVGLIFSDTGRTLREEGESEAALGERLSAQFGAGLVEKVINKLKAGQVYDTIKPWLDKQLALKGQTKQEIKAGKKAAPSASPLDMGTKDFSAGQPRVAPSGLTPADQKKWYEGWDKANLAAPVPEPAAAPKSSGYGAKNTIFTQDAADKARQLLRDKLKNQINSGFDPEIAMAGMQLAGYHIEAGVRKFADLAREIAADLGVEISALKPYIAAWYNGARDMLEGQGKDIDDMDGAGAVRAAVSMIPDRSVTAPVGGIGENEGTTDVSSSPAGVEPDSAGTAASVPAGATPVSDTTGPDASGIAGVRGGTATAGSQPVSFGSLFDALPTVGGTASAGSVRSESPAVYGQPDAVRGDQRGPDSREPRPPVESVGAAAVAAHADGSEPLLAKEAAQAAANSIPVVPGDLDNIRATLPYLSQQQQEDVFAAEQRFEKGDGMLFTNGTGTGKTFTGGGVVARFVRQGKGNVLIVAPSQGIMSDWIKVLAKLNVTATPLESTQDRGKGVSITTYANMANNPDLANRQFDLVVPDESHTLMSAQDAVATKNIEAFRALTNHPRGRYERAKFQLHKEWAPFEAKQAAWEKAGKKGHYTQAAPDSELDRLNDLEKRTLALSKTFDEQPRSKVVFLSATPFAYVKNIEYAEGYLFDYGPDTAEGRMRGYNEPDPQQAFFIQHFGYRMRYGKLTQPDAAVDSGVMEREFHEHLKKSGALSGRVLDEDWDYDRKFVLIDDAIGNNIDKALDWLRENRRFSHLEKMIRDQFSYLNRMRLLEAIKAHHAVPYIKANLALGRQVVVFHDYNQGQGFSPFHVSFYKRSSGEVTEDRFGGGLGLAVPEDEQTTKLDEDGKAVVGADGKPEKVLLKDLFNEFVAANPYVLKMDFASMRNPIETMQAAFPDALIYNGTVSKGNREKAKALFNTDGNNANVIVVQAAAGQAGISLHDTTGKHQRVLVNLGMPVRPTAAIQEEGRIYRIGQKSNAPFRYFNTGTTWERSTFASVISERASTAENLALGNLARTLKQSFIDAFIESDAYPPSAEDGIGGKERDKGDNTLSEFQRSKTFYWAQQKKKGRRDQREGVDYFATPEPVGFKMGEWAGLKFGDKVLEPSAGHGAIARFLPERAARTLVEPSESLATKAELASPGSRIVIDRFENLPVGANKFNAVVMNPPYGVGGKTAMEHVSKAAKHLKNGGRLVALIPAGPAADKRFDEFTEANPDLHLVADILMPSVTFERAGTAVMTHVVVFEKHTDEAVADSMAPTKHIDLTGAESVNELFDRIENIDLPERKEPLTEEAADLGEIPERDKAYVVNGITVRLSRHAVKPKYILGKPEFARLAYLADKYGGRYDRTEGFTFDSNSSDPGADEADREKRDTFLRAWAAGEEKPKAPPLAPNPVTGLPAVVFDLGETTHGKTGEPVFVATIGNRVEREEYQRLNQIAKANGGYYSSFRGGNAIPGFQFKTAGMRGQFIEAVNGNDAGPLAQVQPFNDPFYSALERAIEKNQTVRANAGQWKATLRNTPGVKAEEIEWSGLEEWLDMQEGQIAKDDVLAAVKAGGIQIEERILGDITLDDAAEDEIKRRTEERQQELEDEFFAGYEGGDYYPTQEIVEDDDGEEVERWVVANSYFDNQRYYYSDSYETEDEAQAAADEANGDVEDEAYREFKNSREYTRIEEDMREAVESEVEADQGLKFGGWTSEPGNPTNRELLIILPPGKGGNPDKTPSTHWDQEGVVAHTRFFEKRDAQGRRVLMVDETQSDWHQKGREEGYASAKSPEEQVRLSRAYTEVLTQAQAAERAVIDLANSYEPGAVSYFGTAKQLLTNKLHEIGQRPGEWKGLGDSFPEMKPEDKAEGDKINAALELAATLQLRTREANVALENSSGMGIPDAPFKKSWPALLMKRLIRYAAENDFEVIAWTTGDEQSARYNLSEAVGSISARMLREGEDNAGKYLVRLGSGRAQDILIDNDMADPSYEGPLVMTEEQLKAAFGAEITSKIVEGAARDFNTVGYQSALRELAAANKAHDDAILADLESSEPITGQAMADAGAALAKADADVKLLRNRFVKLEGVDLRVGGEGMKGFYDRNLVNIANDILKKHGSKVEPIQFRNTAMPDSEYDKYPVGHPYRQANFPVRPGFEITDSLRAAAMEGQPLFKLGDPNPDPKVEAEIAERVERIAKQAVKDFAKILPGDKVALDLVDYITRNGVSVAQGQYWRRIITLALKGSTNATWTLAHETIHAMKAMGLFTPTEWNMLVREATKDEAKMANVRKWWGAHNPNMTEEQYIEEAVAELFGEFFDLAYAAKRPWLQRIVMRLINFIAVVAKAGYKVRGIEPPSGLTAHLLMRRMAKGEIGSRPIGFGEEPRDTPFRGAVATAFGQKGARAQGLFDEPEQPKRTMTAQQRAELEARQKQQMARRGGQIGLGDQAGGLFSSERDQDDLFPSDKPKPDQGALFSVVPPIAAASPEFADPATEERWKDATKGVGDGPGLLANAKEWWHDATGGFTRHFRDLPNEPQYSDVGQQFRKLEAANEAAISKAVSYLKDLVGKMSLADYDLFSRKTVLDDLAWEASEHHELPFGFTPATLRAARQSIDAQVAMNPKVIEAVRKRKLHNKDIAEAMVAAGVLTREQIKNPAYFRHMVLDYARHEARNAKGVGNKVQSPYWAKRMGSALDINANLLEAELDWLLKARNDIATAKTIDWIKNSKHNIKDDLQAEAKRKNAAGVAEKVAANPDLEAEQKHFKAMIGMGFAKVSEALESGVVGPIPPHLQQAATDLVNKTGNEPPFALLAWMLDEKKPGAMGAAMIMKYSGLQRSWTRRLLGDSYINPQNTEELVRKLKPEGYRTWQPRDGRHLFTAKTISESALDMFVEKLSETAYPGVDKDELHKALSQIRPQLVVGGERYTMVLPTGIADTLDEFGDKRMEGMVAKAFSGIQGAWKRWTLINPRRFLKYNINNMTGDLDAIIAGNPGTLRKVGKAWTMLRNAANNEIAPEYTDALERGVFQSGLSVQEIPDINRLSALRHLNDDRGTVNKLTIGAVAKVWRALQDSTQFRENLFRLAAYLDYIEKIERGDDKLKIGYGASVPKMVDAVKDDKDRAALLARDLVGDYGSISVAGGWLRKYLIPFWSWTEINTKRYKRLTANAFTQSAAKGIATGGLLGAGIAARAAVGAGIRIGMVYGLIWLWNHLLFGDEEDDLSDLQKRQLHLILGRDQDGEVVTLRTQGALSDVIGMLGFPDAVAGIKAYENGQGSIGQAIKDTLKAPVNRLATGTTPLFSVPLEQALGKELWPDIFNARDIKDRGRHIADTFTLGNEYDQAADRPTRGYGRSWTESVVYRRDPGEMAYDDAKGIAYDWLERVKGQEGFGGTSPRSAALRDYRLALRYGDEESADEALIRYEEAGGTEKGLKTSLAKQHPLGPIAKKDREEFLNSLTDEQLDTLAEAEEYYNRIYLGQETEEPTE